MLGYIRIISALAVCLFFSFGTAYAQDTKEYEARKAKLEKEIAIIDRQLAENASKQFDALRPDTHPQEHFEHEGSCE